MPKINKVSNITKDAIKRKSAYSLPDRPSDMGMKPEDIKRAFWQPVVDVTSSAISEIDRVVDEANQINQDINESIDSHFADIENPHNVTKEQIGLGKCNNTSDMDKPMSNPQQQALIAHDKAVNSHADIRELMQDELKKKVAINDIVDNFNSTDTAKPLSANRGKILYEMIDTTTSKVDESIKNISLNSSNGVLTITKTNGESLIIDLPIEYIVKSGHYNAETKNIELVLDNGEKIIIPVAALVNEYYDDNETITRYVDYSDGNKIKFKISNFMLNVIGQSTNAKHTHDNMNTLNEIDTPFTTSLKSIYDSYDSKIVSLRNDVNNISTNASGIIIRTAEEWKIENPVLDIGQFGYDSTRKFTKIGDGITTWDRLALFQTKSEPNFSTDSWEAINQYAESGTAQEIYHVGDEKIIELSTGEQITLVILGFNHDDKSDGGKAGITIGMKDILSVKYKWNKVSYSGGNTGGTIEGWQGCELRTITLPNLFSQLPTDLTNVIKAVNKKTSAGNNSTDIVITSDKLWMFSLVEIYSSTALKRTGEENIRYAVETYIEEGEQYEYWRINIGEQQDPKNSADKLHKKGVWWLRSAQIHSAMHVYAWYMHTLGRVGYTNAWSEHGILFAFCV